MAKIRPGLAAFLLLASLGLPGCDFMLSLSGVPNFRGVREVAPTPAADFELTTQSGQRLRLGDLQGRVVVLTFLDTDCTAHCLAIARRINETSSQMDYYQEAGRVAFPPATTRLAVVAAR